MSIVITDQNILAGFSKLSKERKISLITAMMEEPEKREELLRSFFHPLKSFQERFDEFSENTISNFHFPYGIAPNFILNGHTYHIPMVIEESSVVAAASKAAKFWSVLGGFHAEVIGVAKVGQVHFLWKGKPGHLNQAWPELEASLRRSTAQITTNMEKRGGGVLELELVDMTSHMDHYYQLKATFDTVDSMGANFINSCLEEYARVMQEFFMTDKEPGEDDDAFQVIMSILSNYSPECRVKAWIEAPVSAFSDIDDELSAEAFAEKFCLAAQIAEIDIHRAATHNKGIFNGIDAVALATGNDFRAIEAGGHAYAARSGRYKSLSHAEVNNGYFKYTLELPLAMGTVGGLTKLHPLADFSLELLGKPKATLLMQIAAAVGLANNFSAISSLVTKGIQIGHMKMHLLNILNHFHANENEKALAVEFFKNHKVTFNAVGSFLAEYRAGMQ